MKAFTLSDDISLLVVDQHELALLIDGLATLREEHKFAMDKFAYREEDRTFSEITVAQIGGLLNTLEEVIR